MRERKTIPGAGFGPARPLGPRDFKPPAPDNSTPEEIRHPGTTALESAVERQHAPQSVVQVVEQKTRKTKKSLRDSGVVQDYKAQRVTDHSAACDVCGWAPPRRLLGLHLRMSLERLLSMLHAHHVIPLCCRGADSPDNLALLCPTHHAVAHRLGQMSLPSKRHRYRTWNGPLTREALVAEIQALEDAESQLWPTHLNRGRDPELLVADLRRRTIRVEA